MAGGVLVKQCLVVSVRLNSLLFMYLCENNTNI